MQGTNAIGKLVLSTHRLDHVDLRNERCGPAVERNELRTIHGRKVIRDHHTESQQLTDSCVTQTIGVIDFVEGGELRVRAQKESFELRVDNNNAILRRAVRLVELLPRILDQIESLVASVGRADRRNKRIPVLHKKIRNELVAVCDQCIGGSIGVGLKAASGLRLIDVVHEEVG